MKNKTFLLIITLAFSVLQPSFGAFPAKHTAAKSLTATNTPTTDYGSVNASLFSDKADSFVHRYNGNNHRHTHRRSGINGSLSLAFGIAGIIFSPLSIPAIIFGAIGIIHHERCALAGLILGIIGTLFLVFILLIAFG